MRGRPNRKRCWSWLVVGLIVAAIGGCGGSAASESESNSGKSPGDVARESGNDPSKAVKRSQTDTDGDGVLDTYDTDPNSAAPGSATAADDERPTVLLTRMQERMRKLNALFAKGSTQDTAELCGTVDEVEALWRAQERDLDRLRDTSSTFHRRSGRGARRSGRPGGEPQGRREGWVLAMSVKATHVVLALATLLLTGAGTANASVRCGGLELRSGP